MQKEYPVCSTPLGGLLIFQMYFYRIPDIFSVLNIVSYPHDECRRAIGILERHIFTTQVVKISDFLKTSK
jgi:hypothetical protein